MKNMNKSQQDPSQIMQVLENKLTLICDMCNHPVLHPQICPSCNQIFCYQCLLKYHQTNKNCPLCHQKLSLNQFLQFDSTHVLQYFRKQLNQLKLSKQLLRPSIRQEIKRVGSIGNSKSQKEKDQQEKCPEHEIPLKYFCETCSKPICSDCGMMSGHHKNHKFIRLNDIYTKIKQKLANQLKRLSNKITQSQQCALNIKKRLQKLQAEHMHIKRYTQEYYILLVEKFQEEIVNKNDFLKEMQQKNKSQIEFYEMYRDGICQQIEQKSRFQLIKDSDQILTSFAIQACEPPEPLKIEESFETIRQLLPDYNNFQYTLHNFSLCTGGILYSDPFILNGVQWRLKIYPKGNGVAKGKYLSVFVEMTKAEKNQKKYEYKIELISKEPTFQNIRRQYCSAFDIGQCWGYNQFILLEDLANGYLNQDQLHFIMGIRNPDYRTLSQDQSNYILQLQHEIKLKELQRQNEMEQTNIIDELQNHSYTLKNSASHSNETKFLKFLQNSSFNEERINERKLKQKQKQREKSEKDQQFQDFTQIHQFHFIKHEKTTNNLQASEITEVKPERNQFFIKDYSCQKQNEFSEFDSNQFTIKNPQTFKKTKNSVSKEEETFDKPKNHSLGFTQKQRSSKETKNERSPLTLTEQKPSFNPQKKQQRTASKNQQQTQQKYEIYFASSKKSDYQLKKQSRKYQTAKNSEDDKLVKKQLKHAQAPNIYKHDFKQIRRSVQPKMKQKIEQQKPKKFEEQRMKRQDQEKTRKYGEEKVTTERKESQKVQQQKRDGIKTKKYIKNSPIKSKNEMEDSESRKKQISQILQQSKKLQGISEQKVSSFLSNMSEVKDLSSNGSIVRGAIKNGQIKQEKEESKPSLKRLKQFEFERN